jgi:type III secretory pathway component EscR
VRDLSTWIALAPLLMVAAACFLKFSIVLSLLGRALGGRTLPALAVSGLSLLLCAFVLAPLAEQAVADTNTSEPVRSFLERQVTPEARKELVELQRGLRTADQRAKVGDRDLVVLAPAFALQELKAAFRIGFFLLLPFLVLDLLVAVALLALGMHTLDARLIALPCKILLFISVDGWQMIAKGLLGGYGSG